MVFEKDGIAYNEWVTIMREDNCYNALFKKVVDKYIVLELSTLQDVESIKDLQEVEFITFYKDDVSYRFKSQLRGIKENTIILSFPEFIKKEERRKFFRMNLVLEVKYTPIKNDFVLPRGVPKFLQRKLIDTTSIDIGGGGIKIYTNCDYEKGQKLFLNFCDAICTTTTGSVVRTEKVEENLYKTSIKFEEMREKDRDILISYLFKQYR